MIDISAVIDKFSLKNPTILASGILGETAGSLKEVAKNGAGAVVTKSIGLNAREGYKNPTVVELKTGLLNAIGLANPGIDEYAREIKNALHDDSWTIPIIGSIYGKDTKEFKILARKMEATGVKGLELNLSCPHAEEYGAEIGENPSLVEEIIKEVKNAVDIPVFVKLTPNITNIVEIAKSVEKAGGDAIVAINTVKAMAINIDVGKPILYNKIGGYSGQGIKPIGIRCVYEIYECVKIPIIGVGGIITGKDAVEYIMAGASAVEIGSGVYYRGVDIFKKICDEIVDFMQKEGYKSIKEMVGIAHE